MPAYKWRFDYDVMAELPPLAWVASVSAPTVTVRCGTSVRTSEVGFFEGTWAGLPEIGAVAGATMVFGSGLVVAGGELFAVPPSHLHEGIYSARDGANVMISNSIVALLTAADLELDPAIPYPTILSQIAALKVTGEDPRTGRVRNSRITIPTSSRPITAWFYELAVIAIDGVLTQRRKAREDTFTSFADYRDRLVAVTRSVLANAPTYEPVVALSSGYDSTAVAVVASQLGCRRALTLTSGRSFSDGTIVGDDGIAVARALGLASDRYDRVAYRDRSDLPEAEFLASGLSGEDVVFSVFEAKLHRTLFLTGFWSGELWVKSKAYPQPYEPGDFSGCTMTEFRLRTDFIHMPLPSFGAMPVRAEHPFLADPDMAPFSIGKSYQRAIPRRIAEEGGIKRGTFADTKKAAGVLLHRDGRDAFAPSTAAAIERFATAQEKSVLFATQPRIGRAQRAAVRAAYRLRVPRLVRGLQARRQRSITFEPRFGNVVFRWAVSVVQPRYMALANKARE